MTSADDESRKVIATNRKAFFNYEILERAEAGVVLRGTEVKSVREGGLNFRDSFVELRAGELWLVGCRIGPYSHGNIQNHFEGRDRKLQFRQHGGLWSISIGASVQLCIRELSKLYDRALRYHARTIAIATPDLAPALFPFCERKILLTDRKSNQVSHDQPDGAHGQGLTLQDPDVWDSVLEFVAPTV